MKIHARAQKKLEGIATITKIDKQRDYGYLKSEEHGDIYFSATACVSAKIIFLKLKEGDELSFEANPPSITEKKNYRGKTIKERGLPVVYRFININPKNS